MWKELKFAWYAISMNLKNSAELRTSFLMSVVGMALNNIAFIAIWCVFAKVVGNIGGWTVMDVVAMQGITALNFGVVFSLLNGVEKISLYVGSGSFDRFILSPKNLLSRVLVSSLGISAIGDALFGVICLGVYITFVHLSAINFVFMFMGLITSTCLLFAVMLLVQTVSFYVLDPRTATRGLFELFFTPTLFHGGAFQGWMRFVFTFIIPSLLVGALPVEVVKSVSWPQMGLMAVLSLLWLILAVKLFYRGVKRYESANLVTFGR